MTADCVDGTFGLVLSLIAPDQAIKELYNEHSVPKSNQQSQLASSQSSAFSEKAKDPREQSYKSRRTLVSKSVKD